MAEPPAAHVVHVYGNSVKRTEELRDVLSCVPLTADSAAAAVRLASDETDTPSRWDTSSYFARLQSETVGATLVTASQLVSTQTLMSENFQKLPNGAVCVADVQTGGKGRGGNTWTSPEGCLMFTFNTRLREGRTLPLLQYVVTLAVVEAIQDMAHDALAGFLEPKEAPAEQEAPPPGTRPRLLDVRIKWPNDIYAGGLKARYCLLQADDQPRMSIIVGGVLCHSVHNDAMFCVTIGVGLNVTNAQPTTCVAALLAAAAAARDASRPVPAAGGSREELLARIMSRYEAMEQQFVADGSFDALRPSYLYHWLHTRQEVRLEEEQGTTVGLTIQGLTPGGYLLATDAGGERYELHPDGNSLDWFAGLVRRKLKG